MSAPETEFAWLIEAPGLRYLRTRNIGDHPEFVWTTDHSKALRLFSKDQADGVMMAVRQMVPNLFNFEHTLGNARPVQHAWIAGIGEKS